MTGSPYWVSSMSTTWVTMSVFWSNARWLQVRAEVCSARVASPVPRTPSSTTRPMTRSDRRLRGRRPVAAVELSTIFDAARWAAAGRPFTLRRELGVKQGDVAGQGRLDAAGHVVGKGLGGVDGASSRAVMHGEKLDGQAVRHG